MTDPIDEGVESNKMHSDTGDKTGNADERILAQGESPQIPKPINGPTDTNDQRKRLAKWRQCRAWVMLVVEIVGVVVVAFYAYFAYGQWQEVIRSNSLTARNIEIANRAWLIAEAASPPLMQPDVPFAVAIRITNTGNSPAYRLRSIVGASVFEGGIPTRLDKWNDVWSPQEHPYSDIIGNKRSSLMPGEMRAFTRQQLADIDGARLVYTIYARIRYDDPLGTERITRYCQFWDVSLKPPGWRFCPVHNSVR